MNTKVIKLEALPEMLKPLKGAGNRIVHCHGVFDVLHLGHVKHFRAAKKHGEVLVVTITADEFVKKGPHQPVFTAEHRAEAIAALEIVDYVAINKWATAMKTIELIRPDCYVKGKEYREHWDDITGGITFEKAAVDDVGGTIVYTDEETFSSSKIINKHLSVLSDEAKSFLNSFTSRHTEQSIFELLARPSAFRVAVIGETIIDEYQYGRSIGKSGKEAIIALKHVETELFAGGAVAIANHVASFVGEVTLYTAFGANDEYSDFLHRKVLPNVKIERILKKESPTIVKRRFLEAQPMVKLFEMYEINDDPLDRDQIQEFMALCSDLHKFDMVFVSDFGHGLLSKPLIDFITEKARFLAVNTQTNAGNTGYNTIGKYSSVDYVCIDEPELRLETRNRYGSVEELIAVMTKTTRSRKVIITRGLNGCLGFSEREGYVKVPAFASTVVDRMGAGDAFLSITAPLVAAEVPMDVIAFIGNVVGAIAVGMVGNREPVSKIPLQKAISALLK